MAVAVGRFGRLEIESEAKYQIMPNYNGGGADLRRILNSQLLIETDATVSYNDDNVPRERRLELCFESESQVWMGTGVWRLGRARLRS